MKYLFLLLYFSILSAEPIAIYLTWQHSPETTMTIQWITLGDEPEQLPNERSFKLPTDPKYSIHSTELKDLEPGTDYSFSLSGKTYKFRTMPATLNDPVRFVVGGDCYCNSLDYLIKTNIAAAQTDPYFALIGGDIAYTSPKPEKVERWIEFFKAWSETMITEEGYLIPIVAAVGNHDVNYGISLKGLSVEAESFFSFFPMPGRAGYNVLDFSNYLSILILDSGLTQPIFGKQTKWLHATLEERQQVPHKFAIYHLPAYPSVGSYIGLLSVLIRKNWCPHFEEYGLDCAFEHNDHAYKRTHLIANNKISPEKGVLYLGDGGWGERSPRSPQERWYLAKTKSTRHFILVTLDQDKRSFAAIDDNGEVFDYVET